MTFTEPKTVAKNARPITILKAVAKLLRANAEAYNQETFREDNSCGTMCCIAGWTRSLTRDRFMRQDTDFPWDIEDDARHVLGLEYQDANILFSGGALDHVKSPVGSKRYAEAGIRHMDKFARKYMGYKGPKL